MSAESRSSLPALSQSLNSDPESLDAPAVKHATESASAVATLAAAVGVKVGPTLRPSRAIAVWRWGVSALCLINLAYMGWIAFGVFTEGGAHRHPFCRVLNTVEAARLGLVPLVNIMCVVVSRKALPHLYGLMHKASAEDLAAVRGRMWLRLALAYAALLTVGYSAFFEFLNFGNIPWWMVCAIIIQNVVIFHSYALLCAVVAIALDLTTRLLQSVRREVATGELRCAEVIERYYAAADVHARAMARLHLGGASVFGVFAAFHLFMVVWSIAQMVLSCINFPIYGVVVRDACGVVSPKVGGAHTPLAVSIVFRALNMSDFMVLGLCLYMAARVNAQHSELLRDTPRHWFRNDDGARDVYLLTTCARETPVVVHVIGLRLSQELAFRIMLGSVLGAVLSNTFALALAEPTAHS